MSTGTLPQGDWMHAEFRLHHSALTSNELKSRLVTKFNAEDRSALKDSPNIDAGKWDSVVLYATQTPSYRLLCVPNTNEELQIYIEPIKANVMASCESV